MTTAPMPISMGDLENRFVHHPPSPKKAAVHDAIRSQILQLAKELVIQLPPGRETSTAITKLEEVMFWANAAVARKP